jgi:hypothetical protein
MWGSFRPFFFVFPPLVVWFDFFYRVFGRFVTRGVQKRFKKKSRENIPSSTVTPKKSSYLLASLFIFFLAAPLGAWRETCRAGVLGARARARVAGLISVKFCLPRWGRGWGRGPFRVLYRRSDEGGLQRARFVQRD